MSQKLFPHFSDSHENHTYEPPPGIHRYTIPRFDFVLFLEMEIYVRAVNELGEATTVPIILEPISAGEIKRKCAFNKWFICFLC